MPSPSVILLGSKPASVVALEQMLQRGWDVRHVVVSRQVQHPWMPEPSLERFALDQGLSVLSQSELPRDEPADFVISYMFRHLVRSDVLRLGQRAALNFHAGPLPEFGGWAFYNVAILEDAAEYGCTCHYMNDKFDEGPLLRVRRFPIVAEHETAFSLEKKAQMEMIQLFGEFLDMAESGQPLPRELQDPSRMRYMSQEEFVQLKEIPHDADAQTIDRYARAFWCPPHPGAYLNLEGRRVEVLPEIAREQSAALLYQNELEQLRGAVKPRLRESA